MADPKTKIKDHRHVFTIKKMGRINQFTPMICVCGQSRTMGSLVIESIYKLSNFKKQLLVKKLGY